MILFIYLFIYLFIINFGDGWSVLSFHEAMHKTYDSQLICICMLFLFGCFAMLQLWKNMHEKKP
jgi:hypothetical protein